MQADKAEKIAQAEKAQAAEKLQQEKAKELEGEKARSLEDKKPHPVKETEPVGPAAPKPTEKPITSPSPVTQSHKPTTEEPIVPKSDTKESEPKPAAAPVVISEAFKADQQLFEQFQQLQRQIEEERARRVEMDNAIEITAKELVSVVSQFEVRLAAKDRLVKSISSSR